MAVPAPHLPGSLGRKGAGPCDRQEGHCWLCPGGLVWIETAALWRCSLYLQGCREPHKERRSCLPSGRGKQQGSRPWGNIKSDSSSKQPREQRCM